MKILAGKNFSQRLKIQSLSADFLFTDKVLYYGCPLDFSTRVIDFITKYDILYINQFGFQKGMSTEYAINSLLHNIVRSMNSDETGFCIQLDFAKGIWYCKPWNSIRQTLILWNQRYGIEMVSNIDPLIMGLWFQSYLKDRMKCTEIGNTQSDLDYFSSFTLTTLYYPQISSTSLYLKMIQAFFTPTKTYMKPLKLWIMSLPKYLNG